MATVLNNPVLQRELIVNLRRPQGFALLFFYVGGLGLLVYLAWPQDLFLQMNLGSRPAASRRLVDMFFLGQYLLASLIAPSFAAGAISGEKERRTIELLLTCPMRPSAILLGKLAGAMSHLGLLIFASLPIVMLCLPLGGTSPLEVLAVYVAILLAVTTFGLISVAWSSVFRRTASCLAVSYLSILPIALVGLLFWQMFEGAGAQVRLFVVFTILPAGCAVIWIWLFAMTARRLLHPPDLGSEGKEVYDEEKEMKEAVGLVINRDQFPDKLFAPPRRDDLLDDGANPIYDKEVHSEIFSQGTLMLRIVIQVSMALALPLMGFCLFFWTEWTPEYVCYVLLFNLLVGPVFSAGSITSERERGTLELLMTTTISPAKILWGKLISGLRVSTVLTLFLVWPILLACVLNDELWPNLISVAMYLAIILMTCLTTSTIGLFTSALFRRTSISLLASYLLIIVLFFGPPAAFLFAETFYSGDRVTDFIEYLGFVSPFSATQGVPLSLTDSSSYSRSTTHGADWPIDWFFLVFYALLNAALVGYMLALFNKRWRVMY